MIELPVLRFAWPNGAPLEEVLGREWLVTNGLGGYASGTISGCNTRRYHGYFVPSLPEHGRTVMLPKLEERAQVAGEDFRLDGESLADGSVSVPSAAVLRTFELTGLVPHWEYQLGDARLSRRLLMVHGEGTLFIEWIHHGGPVVDLTLRPWPAFRFHDRPIDGEPLQTKVTLFNERVEFSTGDGHPPLRLRSFSGSGDICPFVAQPRVSQPHLYPVEKRRGLDHTETLRSPGYFRARLHEGDRVWLAVTVEDWRAIELDPAPFFEFELQRERRVLAQAPEQLRSGVAARLTLAADQFVIDPSVRPADAAWAKASGQDARSVIAGYHWFTDWGRDTMISLDGLCLQTGRLREARAILRTFKNYVKDGLLPNLFPEGGREGLYHTADATLWFFHAIDRYLAKTGDDELLREFFPTLQSIIDHHVKGTHFGIRIDPEDGLFTQGAPGYQLTWMDAKVDDWVVTPRRGKAVELNALWFNACRLMESWSSRIGADASPYKALADRCFESFNARFWNETRQCLFDVVDAEVGGNDDSIRPNQIFSISLSHPVLARDRWAQVLSTVERELLTPYGLRTLSRQHPDYQPKYDGDLRARDAAYHQGTVWPWLLGHFLDAFLKEHGDRQRARALLSGLQAHLSENGVGQICEIFDAEPPFHPRGCIAQAWSVAETLRGWLLTCE